jgi:uncharacterized membrane protein YphA (DoxX/SURF4 family)
MLVSVALLGARLLLASIFAVAAIAKLHDRPGSRQAIIDFGLPSSLAGLPVGSQAPNFDLRGLHGERLTLWSLRSWGKPLLLLFTDSRGLL